MDEKIKNKRETGTSYEQVAIEYISKQNATVLCINYRNRYGEIDIIAQDKETICFIEVKYRATLRAGSPEEAVGYAKQKQICRISDFYRMQNRIPYHTPIRYDVIAICGDRIKWIKNAFDYCGNAYF